MHCLATQVSSAFNSLIFGCILYPDKYVSKLKYQGADLEGEIRLVFLIEHAVTTTN